MPSKQQIGLITLGVVVLLGGVVWFSPWATEQRYQKMPLLDLKQHLDNHSNDALAWRTMALRLAQDGDVKLGGTALMQAFERNPKDAEVGTALGEMFLATNRPAEAFQVLKQTLAHTPNFLLAHRALGNLYRKQGSYHKAVEEYQCIINKDNQDTEIWFFLSQCYWNIQQVANSQQALQEALKLDPKNPAFLMFSANLNASIGKLDEALTQAQQAATATPNDLQIQSNFVHLLLQNHRNATDLQLAEQVMGQMEAINPKHPVLPYQRGELESIRQNWEAAVRYYEKAREVAPDHDEIYFALGKAYRRVHRTADADKMQAYYTKRQSLRRQIDEVKIALGSKEKDAKLYMRLAELQMQLGDRASVINSLETALQIDPKFELAQKRLQQLRPQQSGAPPQ